MTRSAPPASLAAAEPIVPAGVLQDGEVVLLAIKPSGWFVLLVSWPVLAMAALAAAITALAEGFFEGPDVRNLIVSVCIVVACLRLALACVQWFGRMYLLTNRRILRVRAVVRTDVVAWQLTKVHDVQLTAARVEQLLGIASLMLVAGDSDEPQAAWPYIPRPLEVHRIVTEALQRARGH